MTTRSSASVITRFRPRPPKCQIAQTTGARTAVRIFVMILPLDHHGVQFGQRQQALLEGSILGLQGLAPLFLGFQSGLARFDLVLDGSQERLCSIRQHGTTPLKSSQST
ncbi:MAG: hypothetical protein HRU39_12395 [Salinicola sp.]|nr:hypothetical protein [Salinicola sp.]